MTAAPNPILEVQPEPGDSQPFRHHMGQVTGHSAVFFLGTIFNAAAAYGFKVYLARVLGARSLGIYALGMTVVGFMSVFNTLGLAQAAVRFVSAYSATRRLDLLRGFLGRSIFLLLVFNCLLASIMLLVGPWVAVRFYHTPDLSGYMGLFTLLMVLGVLTAFFGHVLAGYKDIARRTVINNFVGSPVTMVLAVALLAAGFGLGGYIFAQVASALLVLILTVILVWRLTPKPVRSFSGALGPLDKEVVSFSATALGLALVGFAIVHADTIVIGFYRNTHELGIYAVTSAIVAFVSIILSSVNQIFAPTIADLYARGQHELLARMFQTLTKWIIGLTTPLAAVLIIFAVPFMRIFGRDFEAGWIVLVIGTIGQLVNCGVGSSGTLLYMSGQQRYLMKIQAVMAVMIVSLNMLLVPLWGITGAALTAALANVISNVWYLSASRRMLGLFPYNRSYLRLILPFTGMLTIVLTLRVTVSGLWPTWLAVGAALALGYLVFIGIALGFGLNPDDQLIARAMWTRLRGTWQKAEVNP